MRREVTLCFYGGVEGQIGGNQILLQDEDTKVLLDFGINFSRWREYFSFPTAMPRNLEEYFDVGLLPEELRGDDGSISNGIQHCFINPGSHRPLEGNLSPFFTRGRRANRPNRGDSPQDTGDERRQAQRLRVDLSYRVRDF